MKTYTFTATELDHIQTVMEINKEFGPRAAFRFYHKLSDKDSIPTEDVEDFTTSFMSQYNKEFGETY